MVYRCQNLLRIMGNVVTGDSEWALHIYVSLNTRLHDLSPEREEVVLTFSSKSCLPQD